MTEEERLSMVYHLVSTNSDKVRVGSLWGTDPRQRLAKYKSVSRWDNSAVGMWVRGVGVDSLRIIPMVVRVCTMREIRMLEQEHIEYYGCEINPLSAYLSEGERREYYCRYGKEYRSNNRERASAYFARYGRENRERIRSKRGEKVLCECGLSVRRADLARHRRSTKHLTWVLDVE